MTKVMIVDDEIYFATNLAKLLREDNKELEIIAVYSAEEALKQLSTSPVDIIVSDIRLPNMNGINFIEQVKKRWPDTGIIIMTAFGAKEIMAKTLTLGALFFIEKPFMVQKLQNIITMATIKNQTR